MARRLIDRVEYAFGSSSYCAPWRSTSGIVICIRWPGVDAASIVQHDRIVALSLDSIVAAHALCNQTEHSDR